MGKKTITDKISVGHKWLRLLYMALFAIVGWLLECLIILIAIFQFIYSLFTDKPLETLQPFARSLSKYIMQIVAFLTFASEEKPFPFSNWPDSGEPAPKKKPPKKPAEKAEKP